MHFHYLWALDRAGGAREEFWETVLAVCASAGIPEIGKLIGPGVAAEIGVTIEEFEPLLMALTDLDDSVRASAEKALAYCIRPLLAERGSQPEATGLLCDLAERLSDSFTIQSAHPTCWVLSNLLEQLDQLSAVQARQVGTASRRLLAFAWAQSPRNEWLVGNAIECVSRTVGTDVEGSSGLLRRALEPEHLAQYGSEELRRLAVAVPSLTPHDPSLVRDIYRAAFGYSETSDEPTPIRRGVLSLTSNRRQDYELALYGLVRAYPGFLRAAPQEAVEAMNAALEWHVAHRRAGRVGDPEVFDLDGHRARLLPDHSGIWDRGQRHKPPAVELLDHMQAWLGELAEEGDGNAELADLLRTLVRTCRLAVVWRRLLDLGALHTDQVGMRIRGVTWSLPVLVCRDTIGPVGKMVGAVFLDLSARDRKRIERAVLSIPAEAPPEHPQSAERQRDRLLGCLPENGLVTLESRARLSQLRAAGSVPTNEDDIRFEVVSKKFGELEYLGELGVPVDEAPNKRLQELEAPVKKFAEAYLNEVPKSEDLREVLPHLRRLYRALQSSENDGVHQHQADYAWGKLAEACAAIAKIEDLQCRDEAGTLARTVLLEACGNRVPTAAADDDEHFVEPRWGKPAARIDAAAGLMTLLRHPSCDNPDALTATERLIVDPSPAVRYQIAQRLVFRYTRDPEWTWRMIEQMAQDPSPGVLHGLVGGPLNSLRFREPKRVARITRAIYRADTEASNRSELNEACVDVLADLFVWGKDSVASAVIERLANDSVAHLEEVGRLVTGFRDILITGAVDPADREADAARQRSWGFLLRVTRAAAAEFRRGVEQKGETHCVTEDRPTEEQMKDLAHLLDSVGSNIYSISGAHDDKESPDEQVLRRLYSESREVIEELAETGLPSLSHHLLETLEVLIPFDPRGVFRRIARVVHGGRKGGYQFDSLAHDAIVRLVNRYLADHRDLFQRDEEARQQLVQVLDTFVEAGSEGARRLSYGLAGIFQ